MGNSLRCCLACMIPCGALDVVRIVHLNGHIEEYCRQVFAGEILKANPNHILSKPSSQDGGARHIMILSLHAELHRGHIYFLIPATSIRQKKKKQQQQKKKQQLQNENHNINTPTIKVQDQDSYLAEILEEKESSHRGRRRSGRVRVWRPHLDIIAEEPVMFSGNDRTEEQSLFR